MSINCLVDTGSGYVLSSPQPTDYTSCTYLIVQPSDIPAPWFNLTAEQGTQISMSIALIWGIGFCWRALIQVAKNTDKGSEDA